MHHLPSGGKKAILLKKNCRKGRCRKMSDQYRPFGRKARQLAFIDHDWCIGCGYCAMFCITKCIYQQPDGFWTVDQDHCIGCRSCKVNCFMGAVTMLPPPKQEG